MKKSKLVTALIFCAVMVFVVSPLAAQTSNTASSTYGIFGNDIDKFMSTTDYGSVDFNKGFLYFGLNYTSYIGLGYAMNLGDNYLGVYYDGNVFRSRSDEDLTKTIEPTIEDDVEVSASETYFETDKFSNFYDYNILSVLYGFGDMGIKFKLSHNANSLSKTSNEERTTQEVAGVEVQTTTKTESLGNASTHDPDDITFVTSSIKPYVEFGTQMYMNDMLVKPFAGLSVDFNKRECIETEEIITTNDGSTIGIPQTKENFFAYDSKIEISPSLGASLIMEEESGNKLELNLYYKLGLNIFNSPMADYPGAPKTFKGATGWEYESTTTITDDDKTVEREWNSFNFEKNEMSNIISLDAKYTIKPAERLNLGVGGRLYAKIENSKTEFSVHHYEIEEFTDNNNSSNNTVETFEGTAYEGLAKEVKIHFYPEASLAMQYQLVPEKLTLNAGALCNLPWLNHTKTIYEDSSKPTKTKHKDTNGDITEDTIYDTDPRTKTENIYSNWAGTDFELSTGFTWNITENAMLDVGLHSDVGMSTVSIFSLIDTSMSLKFTFKY